MTLHDTIQADARTVFCNADDFAESLVYYPRLGESRCINGVVVRESLTTLAEDGGETVVPTFEIHVENDSTYGISSDEINLGGDALAFAIRVGEARSTRTITRIMSHDEGMLVLECR